MRKRVKIGWIEQSEARFFIEHATLYRAASETQVSIESAASGSIRFNWLRGLARPLGRTIVAARSSLGNRTILLRARSIVAWKSDPVPVAVLVTDIVGSTKLVVEMGDRNWRVLLHRHDEAVRRQIRSFGGREVGHRGDGFVGIFDTAARAVACATAIADSVSTLGLLLRCGIHFGEVHLAGDKVSGLTAHIAARIMATARPGETIVSEMVRDLVMGPDVVFEDCGVHRLRDLPEAVQLYAARAVVRQ